MLCPYCQGYAELKWNTKREKPVLKCLSSSCKKVTVIDISKYSDTSNKNYIPNISNEYLENFNSITTDYLITISNVKKLRTELGLLSTAISKKLHFSVQRYMNIERCDNMPSVMIAGKVCKVFGVTLNDMYDYIQLSKEQYDTLSTLVFKNINGENVIVKDEHIRELAYKIAEFEKQTGIVERRIYKKVNVDSPDIVEKKLKLQEMDKEFAKYCKSVNAILKHKCVLDYYDWELVKNIVLNS